MQKLTDGALGASATELFYMKSGKSVNGAPQGEEEMPRVWLRFPADGDRQTCLSHEPGRAEGTVSGEEEKKTCQYEEGSLLETTMNQSLSLSLTIEGK